MNARAVALLRAELNEAGVPFEEFEVTATNWQQRLPVLSVTVRHPMQLPTVRRVMAECAPGRRVLELDSRTLLLAATRLAPAVPLAELGEWQTSSPTGGLVTSEWLAPSELARGQVVRWTDGWAAIAAVENNPWQVLVHTRTGGQVWTIRHSVGGMDVRTDMRINREDLL